MFKLAKYEFRKNLTGPIILFAVIGALELLFLGSKLLNKEGTMIVAFIVQLLAMFFAYYIILILSISSYSRELSSKSSYMTFMAPVNAYQVIGSKLLSAFFVSAIFGVIMFVFVMLNYLIMEAHFSQLNDIKEAFEVLMEIFGYNIAELLLNVVMFIVELMISFYLVVVLAYFAISLSSTVFQNKKFKWVVSTVIFLVIYISVVYMASHLPTIGDPTTLGQAFISELPTMLFYLVFIVGGYVGSAVLLEKAISL